MCIYSKDIPAHHFHRQLPRLYDVQDTSWSNTIVYFMSFPIQLFRAILSLSSI